MVEVDAIDAQSDGVEISRGETVQLGFTEDGSTSEVELSEPTNAIANSNLARNARKSSSPLFMSQDDPSHDELLALGEALRPGAVKKRGIAVVVPPVQRPWEYLVYEEPEVKEIVEAYDDDEYLVQFEDEREEVVSLAAPPHPSF